MENYGCKDGLPHELELIAETRSAKWEVCHRCSRRFRWLKWFKGRIDNPAYLKAHARNYAQPGGATNRLYMKLYKPDKCVIKIHE